MVGGYRSKRRTASAIDRMASQTHAGGLDIPDNDPVGRGYHAQDSAKRTKITVNVGQQTYSAPPGMAVKHLTTKTDVRIIPRSTLLRNVFGNTSNSYLDIELDKIPIVFSDHATLKIILRNAGATDFVLDSVAALFDRIELRPSGADTQVTYYTADIFEALYMYADSQIRANCEETHMFSPTQYELGRAYLPNNKDRVVVGDGIPGTTFSTVGNLTGVVTGSGPYAAGAVDTAISVPTSFVQPGRLIVKAGDTEVFYLPLNFLFYFHESIHIPSLCAGNRPVIRFYFANNDTIIGNTYNFSAGRDDVSDDPAVLFPSGTRAREMIAIRQAGLLTVEEIEIKIQGTCYTSSEHDKSVAMTHRQVVLKTCLPQRFINKISKVTSNTPIAEGVTLTGLVGSTAGLTMYFKKARDVDKAGANRHFVGILDSTWRTSGGRVIDEDRKTSEIHSRLPERIAFNRTSELNPFIKGHCSLGQYYFERPDAFSYTKVSGDGTTLTGNTGVGLPRGLSSGSPFFTGTPDETPRIYAEFYCRDIIGDIHQSTETGSINYDGNFTFSATFGNDFYDRPLSAEDLLVIINQQRNSSIYIESGKVVVIRH